MDESTFDEFYAGSYRRLVGQIYGMCGNLTEAQDCVQEAFVRAWDKRRSLDMDQYPEAWVRTVAYRLAVSRWRRARRALLPPDRALAASASDRPGRDPGRARPSSAADPTRPEAGHRAAPSV